MRKTTFLSLNTKSTQFQQAVPHLFSPAGLPFKVEWVTLHRQILEYSNLRVPLYAPSFCTWFYGFSCYWMIDGVIDITSLAFDFLFRKAWYWRISFSSSWGLILYKWIGSIRKSFVGLFSGCNDSKVRKVWRKKRVLTVWVHLSYKSLQHIYIQCTKGTCSIVDICILLSFLF